MKFPSRLAAVAFGLGLATSAYAGSSDSSGLRRNETYCLETSLGSNGGGTIIQCMYETLQQCYASKTQGETCMLNPRLAYAGGSRLTRH